MAPVVVDGAVLHEEVVEEDADLLFRERAVLQVVFDIRQQHVVQIAERTDLEAVDVFAEHEIHVDEQQDFVGVGRSSRAELFQRVGDIEDAFRAVCVASRVVAETRHHLQHGVICDVDAVVVGFLFRRQRLLGGKRFAGLLRTAADARKAKREDGEPVWNGMVEIDPAVACAADVHLVPQGGLREIFAADFLLEEIDEGRQRAVVAVPAVERREEVMRIDVDSQILRDELEDFRLVDRARQCSKFLVCGHFRNPFFDGGVVQPSIGGACEGAELLPDVVQIVFE